MMNLCYVLAILTMVIGHIAKTRRWAQFIEVYEPVEESDLLKTLSISHSLNAILPFRVGDFFRIWRSSKYLKNGYTLSVATVVVDLYLDVVTVGLIFQGLVFLGNERLVAVSHVYLVLLVIAFAATLLGVFLRKRIKKLIQYVASIFNEKIELGLLYISYAVIACFKDIVRKLHKKKFLLYTIEMWGCYLFSYGLFATSLTQGGKGGYELSDIFSFIFSENCTTVVVSSLRDGTLERNNFFALNVMVYMLLPLVLVGVYSLLYKRLRKKAGVYTALGNSTHAVKDAHGIAKNMLPHLSENDKLAFLEMYFADENIDTIDMFLSVNQDLSILNDLSAGSNATTVLGVKAENEFCYRKYAFLGEAEKLKEQYEWLMQHKGSLPLAEVSNPSDGVGYFAYDMNYRPDAVGFFHYIHSMPGEMAWRMLERVVSTLREKLYVPTGLQASRQELEDYVSEKVQKNISVIENGGRYIKDLLGYDRVVINGEEYPNFSYFCEKLGWGNLMEIFSEDMITDIHGDLTIENIVCCKSREEEFYLIDPNTGNRMNTAFIDFAKLLQSLHGGYEFLMTVKSVAVEENRISFTVTKSQNYAYLYEKYDALLNEMFTEKEVRSIYYHEIVHWLRLMPYKIRKNEQMAVVFFAGMIMVMDDVMKRFGE